MKLSNVSPTKFIVLLFVLFLSFSCSKDSDLLSDYILADGSNALDGLVVDDVYMMNGQGALVMDVLSNDGYSNQDNVEIVGTSIPRNGTVIVNEDKTLTYIPGPSTGTPPADNTPPPPPADNTPPPPPPADNTPPPADNTPPPADNTPPPPPPADNTPPPPPPADNTPPPPPPADNTPPPPPPADNTPPPPPPADNTPPPPPADNTPPPADNTPPPADNTEEVDSFTYTTEVTNEDQSVSTETATVTVNSTEDPNNSTPANNTVPTGQMGELRAFPGAEGFGKYTTGGRGGTVYNVTNLNDSGAGSFRAAVQASGTRTVIFKVAGNIVLNSVLDVKNPNITIAGETAPGDGITLTNNELSITTSNVIIRNLRFRRGHSNPSQGLDALSIKNWTSSPIENIIIDHCTMSWGIDESIDTGNAGNATGGLKNMTISNSIIGPSQPYGWLLWYGVERMSSYRNFFVGNAERNPTIQSPAGVEEIVTYLRAEKVNNITYGANSHGVLSYGIRATYIGNVSKDYTGQTYPSWASRIYSLSTSGEDGAMRPNTQFYSNDNILVNTVGRILEDPNVEAYRVGTPTESSNSSLIAASALEADLLPNVGPLKRDSYDASLIASYYASTAPRQDESLPGLSGGTAYTDSDSDGMSDAWETANGLDNNNPEDGKIDSNGDGYTNLEEFLYSLTL